MTEKTLDEPVLSDDYPIYAYYCYVADGRVIRSDWHNVTAKQFKNLTGTKELRRCDMIARGMKFLLVATTLTLLTAPVLAQSSKSSSDAASRAAAVASGGFHQMTNNFGGPNIPKNTPDVVVSPGSVSGSDCQLPGFALGGGLSGLGAALSFPGGTDEECKALTLASFYAKLSNSVTDAREAQQYRQTSVALTCQVPRMRALPLCATAAAPALPATYAPAVMPAAHAAPAPTQQSYRQAYSYADLKATPWYCDNPAGYYPAVSLCSAWRQVQR